MSRHPGADLQACSSKKDSGVRLQVGLIADTLNTGYLKHSVGPFALSYSLNKDEKVLLFMCLLFTSLYKPSLSAEGVEEGRKRVARAASILDLPVWQPDIKSYQQFFFSCC